MIRRLLPFLLGLALASPAFAFTQGHIVEYSDSTGGKVDDSGVPSINIGPSVATNAALAASCTAASGCPANDSIFTGGVWRIDFTTGGAPPVWYKPSGSACSAADNGSQVTSADSKCWLAQFPVSGADVREWGVLFDGSTDNSTTLQKAFTWAAANNGVLRLPTATSNALFSSAITVTLPTTTSSLSVFGEGHDGSVLQYSGASGTAITVNYNATAGKQNSTHWRDFTLCTNHTGGATGIVLVETTAGSGQIAVNDFTNVTLRGCDGYGVTNYWTTAINIQAVSEINFPGLTIFGGSTALGTGVLINGTNGALLGFQYNFPYVDFVNLNEGIQTSQDVQGVAITAGSNFTGITTAIYVPTGSGTDQLTVSDSQFNCLGVCINTQSATNLINNNYFILSGNNVVGIALTGGNGFQITNNFYRNGGGFTGNTGEQIGSGALFASVITGNTYSGIAYGRSYTASGAYPDFVANNLYPSIGHGFPLITAGATVLDDQQLTFATTVACSSSIIGRTQFIADSTTTTWGATVTGLGANPIEMLCDGTNWTVMGK